METVAASRRRAILFVAIIGAAVLPAWTGRALDLNSNGLDDVWEIIYGAGALTAAADTDGDGVTNAQESAAGTDPFDPRSRPALSIAPWSPTQLQMGYARVPGKRYRIESKTNLSLPAWTPEFTEVAPSAGAVAYLFNIPGGSKFWRLAVD